ncbi:hypothetical protein N7481_002167 [Penicillium waksmanii]|uniref:uncharacterized protein n=1 Tax=Penicillium waksmanii TaxID=69791 RepID=UPI0025474D77|nr:uncharacterized protein N7481_002167 [Penicillium waksmanii]KAJ5995190.1 hypothetical protein N7481_002167 [Penicillium waksmanii]
MDPTSLDSLATRWDGSRLSSSSFPRQGWSRLSPSYAPPAGNAGAGPSHYASWRHFDSAADDPDYRLRATTLRQMNQDPHLHSSSRADRSISILPSAPTQPVLVRAYSGNADDTTSQSSTMSPRRFFPFTGSKTPASSRPSGPPLPAVQDFSIESILQAIEPDIRGTLDSIAEICGRSKLSLANEYESHIAPLGEIRAPQGGLGPVEEASSNDERRADEGVVIFDDDPSMMNAGQEIHPFSFYRYLESLRQAASARERSGASGLDLSARTQIQQLPMQPAAAQVIDAHIPPATREFVSRPQTGRDLLAKTTTAKRDGGHSTDVTTPAVVSEAHVDAQAASLETPNGPQPPLPDRPNSPYITAPKTWYAPEAVRSVLGWLKWTAHLAEPESRPALQSAESRLRAMLARSLDETTI